MMVDHPDGHVGCPGCATLRRDVVGNALIEVMLGKRPGVHVTKSLVEHALNLKNPLPEWCWR